MTEIANREMYKVAKLVPSEAKGARQEVGNWWKDVEKVSENLTSASVRPDYEIKVGEILNNLSGFSSIVEMRQFIDIYEGEKLAFKAANRQKYEKALESTSLVSQGVFLMVEDQVGWNSSISVDDIEEWLPMPLKGLGEAIVNNLVSDVDLKTTLDGLDTIKRNTRFTSKGQVNHYLRVLDSEIQRVSGLNEGVNSDQNFYEEKSRVLIYLQHKINQGEDIMDGLDDEDRIEVPDDIGLQYEKSRDAIGYIEDSGFKFGDILVSRQTNLLIKFLGDEKVKPEVKREISARIHLHGIYQGMYGAGGFLDSRIPGSIPNVLQHAYDNQGELSMGDMTFFLRDGSNGMNVQHFWDRLMDINYGNEYARLFDTIGVNSDFCKKVYEDKEFWIRQGVNREDYFLKDSANHGKIIRGDNLMVGGGSLNEGSEYYRQEASNYQYDSDIVRKEIVKKFLLSEVSGDKALLSKGLELADKLIVATGEDATMNAAFAGHHDLAELILTEANTYDRKSKGKTTGSRRALRPLVSLTPTWLRAISDRDAMGPLKCKDINFSALGKPKGSEYFYYTAILMKKTIPYQKVMMEEVVDVKSIGQNPFWKDLYDQVNKVAKYPSIIVDAKRGPSPGKIDLANDKDNPLYVDIPGPVLRDVNGAEILDVVIRDNGSVDMENSNIMSIVKKPNKPAESAPNDIQEAYKTSMEKYKRDVKIMAYRKEMRLRELVVEGIAHLSASRPEVGMSITQFKQLGAVLTREMKIREDKGHEYSASFLTKSQWENIYNAYSKGITEAVGSRKIMKRNMKEEEEDKVADVTAQVVKTAISGK